MSVSCSCQHNHSFKCELHKRKSCNPVIQFSSRPTRETLPAGNQPVILPLLTIPVYLEENDELVVTPWRPLETVTQIELLVYSNSNIAAQFELYFINDLLIQLNTVTQGYHSSIAVPAPTTEGYFVLKGSATSQLKLLGASLYLS